MHIICMLPICPNSAMQLENPQSKKRQTLFKSLHCFWLMPFQDHFMLRIVVFVIAWRWSNWYPRAEPEPGIARSCLVFLRTTVCDRRHKHVFTRSRLTPYCAPLLGVAADAVAAVREHTSPIGAQTKLRCASNAHHTQPNIHRTIEPAPHRPGGATARTGAVIITSAPSTATDDCVLQRAENIDLIYV